MDNKTVTHAEAIPRKDRIISIGIIGVLFFTFGFVSWINAILIPYFKIACELTNFQAYLVAFAFYISYLVMSMPASYILRRKGFKKGMLIGFWVMAFGAFMFVPAAYTRTYHLFLIGLFSLGSGLAILQTAANPYITILGPKESAAQRISIMGICNKAAGILAPILFATVVLRASDSELFALLEHMDPAQRAAELDMFIRRVMVPYAVVGMVLFILGIFVRYSPLPDIDTEHEEDTVMRDNVKKTGVLQFPHLVLGAIAIFLHVGTQVISIDTVIGYAGSMGIDLLEAKTFPSYTLFLTIVGYLMGIVLIPKVISQVTALRICTVLGLVFTLSIIFVKGQSNILGHSVDLSIWFVVLLGLANSLIWAGIWPLALSDLGKFTKQGGALLIMGLCGNAIMPMIYGYFADKVDLRSAYWVLAPCYLYLIFYATQGHKYRSWKKRVKAQLKKPEHIIGIVLIVMSLSSHAQEKKITFIVVQPQHFHAALTQKSMPPGVDENIYLYAASQNDVEGYLRLINQYNDRLLQPTSWKIKPHYGADFITAFERGPKADAVILAGNNGAKITYIEKSVNNGLHVFADKPLVINAEGYDKLVDIFHQTSLNNLIVYDMMTERFETKNQIIQRLIQNKNLSGGWKLDDGEPAIKFNSTHYFLKTVSGAPLIRPNWVFDTAQQGEGLVDVSTHYIDLVQWLVCHQETLDPQKDILFKESSRWNTVLSLSQYQKITGEKEFAYFLRPQVSDGDRLNVASNGILEYSLKGVPVEIKIQWHAESQHGEGDELLATYRTNNFTLTVQPDENGRSNIFIKPNNTTLTFERDLQKALNETGWDGLSLENNEGLLKIVIPEKHMLNHEEHFAKVVEQFLAYVKLRKLPDWEQSFMLSKYYLTTLALSKAKHINL